MWPYMNLLGSQFCHLTDSFYSPLKGHATIWPYGCVGTCVWKMWWRGGGMGWGTRPSSRVLSALIQSLDITLYITNKKEQSVPGGGESVWILETPLLSKVGKPVGALPWWRWSVGWQREGNSSQGHMGCRIKRVWKKCERKEGASNFI